MKDKYLTVDWRNVVTQVNEVSMQFYDYVSNQDLSHKSHKIIINLLHISITIAKLI